MTREEAIKILEQKFDSSCRNNLFQNAEKLDYENALWVAITALRPISQEQVEKVWKGCPECKHRCGLCVHMRQWDKYGKPYVCESCVDFSNFESEQQFCEVCGAPMTDEAVQMVMERFWEVLRCE